ncbi:MAG: hypothetical protein Q9225_004720 [Loekoesia sp. 1 TL-2023]
MALAEDGVVARRLTELTQGLNRVCDTLVNSSDSELQQAIDEDGQACSGAPEALSERFAASIQSVKRRPSGAADTNPLPGDPNTIPNLFSTRLPGGQDVPYGSRPPYPLASDPNSETLDEHLQTKELLDLNTNISQIPQDGRVMLSPGSTRPEYLQWTKDFCERLENTGGAFWVRDFDSAGRIKHYHHGHLDCNTHRQNIETWNGEDVKTIQWIDPHGRDEALFDVPPAVWPKNRRDYQLLRSNPTLCCPQAPWKRLVLVSEHAPYENYSN